MKILATAVACCMAFALTTPSFATDKDAKTNKDKLVGVWELTKGEAAPAGATVEFTKDGKMIVTIKDGDQTMKHEGTYTIDKDSITTTVKVNGEERKKTVKIKKLTDKELIVDEDNGKTDEFKKK